MTSLPSPSTDAINAALDALLAHQPPPRAFAINPNGELVKMPPAVPVRNDRVIVGPASGLQLVISDDIAIVIKTWNRALQDGVATGEVHLLGKPAEAVSLSIVDARDRYGVLLAFIVEPSRPAPNTIGDQAEIVYYPIRPRRWTSTKDSGGVIIDVDPAVTEVLGWRPDQMIGRRSLEFIHPDDWARATANWMVMLSDGVSPPIRLRRKHRDGSWAWFESINNNLLNDPEHCCVKSEIVDISEEMAALVGEETSARKRVEKELVDAAFRDPLTELPNRSLFIDRLRRALESGRAGGGALSVLILDCDRFASVNNSFGHAAGDLLLVALARRFAGALRQGDLLARIGGDEFAVLIDEIGDGQDALPLAERMLASLSQPFALSGVDVYVRASIGIAISRECHESADEMVRDADIAMYRAKARGRHRYEVFHIGLRDRTKRITQLEIALRHAIERNELSVHYQPIIALAAKRIIGFEALLRWHHPQLGAVSPIEFIPIAEENGLIFQIGEWVMLQACRRTRLFQTTAPGYETLTINVNVSLAQFRESGFIESVDRVLRGSGLPARYLNLELTESLLMDDLAGMKAILKQLRERGIDVHIDDFGTGYSSLAYLDQLSVQTLKIDKTFISRIGNGLANPEIVETVLKLARQLGVTVTAEGVETIEQERQLRALDCANGQGFLFSAALDAEHVNAFFAKWDEEHRSKLAG